MIAFLKMFFLLFVASMGLTYALTSRTGIPFILPGDFLIIKAGRRIYLPIGSSLILSIIFYVLLNSLF